MPKRLPPNNRPWPDNMAFDFGLPTLSPADAEGFIASLPTSDRNRQFLLLRYREGKIYDVIAAKYGLNPSGVRAAVKAMWKRFGKSPPSTVTAPPGAAPSPPVAPASPVHAPMAARTVGNKDVSAPAENENRPLPLNLAAIRRALSLTPEEFARPLNFGGGEALMK